MNTFRFVFLVFFAIFGACSNPDQRPATWSYIHAAIIVPSCSTASCHSSLTAQAGIVLEDRRDAFDILTEQQLVVPGDMNSSLLLLLRGEGGPRMPPDAPIPDADIDLIEEWIIVGAERE